MPQYCNRSKTFVLLRTPHRANILSHTPTAHTSSLQKKKKPVASRFDVTSGSQGNTCSDFAKLLGPKVHMTSIADAPANLVALHH